VSVSVVVMKGPAFMQHRLIVAVATALLAGCAAPSNPPAPQVSAAPQPSPVAGAPASAGASQFDGVYRGKMTVVSGGGYGARCGVSQDNASVTVRDGVVQRRWGGNMVEAAVRPDGSFSTAAGVARMRGQITGQSMDFEINGPACMQHFTLTRS
jgi:hypothetical protein